MFKKIINLQDVIDMFKNQRTYYIVAYSLGTVLALEIARLLEKNGVTGSICLIDGNLKMVKGMHAKFIATNLKFDPNKCLKVMSKLYLNNKQKIEFMADLLKAPTNAAKIDTFLKYLPDEGTIKMYIRKSLENADEHNEWIQNYADHFDIKLQANIHMVHCKESQYYYKESMRTSQPYTNGKISADVVDGNHTSMLNNDKLVQIINAMLAH